MATLKRALVLYWVDVNGATIAQPITTQDQTPVVPTAEQDLIDALQAVSCAGLAGILLRETKMIEAPPTAGAYATALDVANFVYLCANGKQTTIAVPAPDESIFANELDVDLANADVIELMTQLEAIAADREGSPVITLVSATRGIIPRQTTPQVG